ncbi:MAG TPA: response regulator, partial [Elusimicrobiales bacterium]|nr:response regulator [Elusimicrobiales bacterium]
MAKILCVDDDKDILDTYEVILSGLGHEVLTAANGKEGLEQAQRAKPQLIIMDVMMENSTDGFHAVYAIRKDAAVKYTPILMMTSINAQSAQKFGKEDAEYLPVDAFMDKPVRPKEFVARVKELL